jgi:predicted HicB family RNase H-like nuclease
MADMAEFEKRITVKVSETLHRKVKVKAAMIGKSISDILREYLEAWVEEPLPEPDKED